MTSQNMQAAAAALKFAKSKTSEEKQKKPHSKYESDGSWFLPLRIGAPRASVDFSCVLLLFLLFCAAHLASRLEHVVAYVREETQGNPDSTELLTHHHVFLPCCDEPLQIDT